MVQPAGFSLVGDSLAGAHGRNVQNGGHRIRIFIGYSIGRLCHKRAILFGWAMALDFIMEAIGTKCGCLEKVF